MTNIYKVKQILQENKEIKLLTASAVLQYRLKKLQKYKLH